MTDDDLFLLDFMESLIEFRGERPVERCGHWLRVAIDRGYAVKVGPYQVQPTPEGRAWYSRPRRVVN